jgi:DNA invertase Pin-like site-specific DNA recombinase
MRAVVYCRVSAADQVNNLTLVAQEKSCREYCARNGYDVDHVFVDAAESADTRDRPEFLRMLTTCRERKGRLHAVIVYSLTPFSRSSADQHAIQALLRGLGITLRSVTEPSDESLSGRLMEGILAAMAQFDQDVRSERAAGLTDSPERGRWPWLAPIGYLNADASEGPSIVPDPARAPAVREAFELYATGIRGRDLLDRVTDIGLVTRRGNKLTINRLYELLRNRAYIGLTSAAAWAIESKGDFEPLVSEDLFVRVQGEFAREAKESLGVTSHRNHPAFALRRFTMCEMCGRPLTGSQSTGRNKARYAFYHCIPGCTRVPAAKMEAAFLELLDGLRPQPERWHALQTSILDVWRLEEKTNRDARMAANRRAGELEAQLGRLEQAFVADRAIDADSYRRERDQVREELVLARLEASDAALLEADFESMLAFADHALHQASALWTSAASTEERIRLQWALFPNGCTWSPRVGNFERPVSCFEFFELANLQQKSHEVVDLARTEPVTS